MPRFKKRIIYTNVEQWKSFLDEMGTFRKRLFKAEENMAFYGKEHNASDRVRAAIDELAGVLTGDPKYYWLKAQGAYRAQGLTASAAGVNEHEHAEPD